MCIACYHCVKKQGVEVRAEGIDRIFLEGHKKLISMVVSWEGNWGANVKSTVPPQCPLASISQVDQTLSLASELKEGTAGREEHKDDNEVQGGTRGEQRRVRGGTRRGCWDSPIPGGTLDPGLPALLCSPENPVSSFAWQDERPL